MKTVIPTASCRRICRVLSVPRSTLYPSGTASSPSTRPSAHADDALSARIHALIQQHPTYGYRRIWALLRSGDKLVINRKRVYHIMRRKRWFVSQRTVTPKPRVKKRKSVAATPNERWAMDVTHIPVGRDGWAHLTAVIDCHDRELVGYEFALRGRAKEAERALEAACIARFGTVRPMGATPVVRSDNGLIFQSRRFREACRFYRLEQEYITPYTPEQNGIVERFFRSGRPLGEGGMRLAANVREFHHVAQGDTHVTSVPSVLSCTRRDCPRCPCHFSNWQPRHTDMR